MLYCGPPYEELMFSSAGPCIGDIYPHKRLGIVLA